jgi:exodeoxyribonuclease VII small subunit
MAKKELTYKQAMQELEAILAEIESEDVDIDKMTGMIKRATELIEFCKTRLTKTKDEIEKSLKLLDNNK